MSLHLSLNPLVPLDNEDSDNLSPGAGALCEAQRRHQIWKGFEMLSHPPTHQPLVLNALEARNCDGAQPLPFQVGKSTWKNESRQRTWPNTVGKSHAPVRKQDRRQEAHQRRAWKQSRGPWCHRGCFWGFDLETCLCQSSTVCVSLSQAHWLCVSWSKVWWVREGLRVLLVSVGLWVCGCALSLSEGWLP